MKFLTGKDYATEVGILFRETGRLKNMRCAVAFWGDGAKKYLGYLGPQSKIICNLESGATNPDIIQAMRDKKIEVKTLYDLHAKVYLGRKAVIIGSANCSTNGLALEEESGWIEAGLLTSEKAIVESLDAWFLEMWGKARSITKGDISKARQAWKERRMNRPALINVSAKNCERSLLTVLKDNPRKLFGRNIYLEITNSDLDDAAEKCAKDQGWHSDDIYQDWPDLPVGALMISAWIGDNEKSGVNGLYKSTNPHSVATYKDEDGEHKIIHVYETRDILGLKLTKQDKSLLRKRAVDIWTQCATKKEKESNGCAVPIERVREILFGKSKGPIEWDCKLNCVTAHYFLPLKEDSKNEHNDESRQTESPGCRAGQGHQDREGSWGTHPATGQAHRRDGVEC